MRYQKFSISIILLFTFQLNAQTIKEVDNGIFVTFPITPEYKLTPAASTYVCKTENCLFIVIIQRNVVPNYVEYMVAKKKFTEAEIQKIEDGFLDNTVKGKLEYTGNKGTISSIKIGKYNGRKIEYSAINPATGERGKRYTKLFLVRDRAISFDVMVLNDNQAAYKEVNQFLNSIQSD